MVAANAITFLSYLSICLTLFFLAGRTRRVIARDWAWFLMGFALFIVACGSTHLMEVVTTWWPFFWVDAAANIVTAVLSAYVALNLIRRAPAIGFSVNDYAARLARTESEKRQMLESLLSAQKLEDWSRMSAVLAHEIGNPLEAIQNLLYLIRSADNVSPDIVDLANTAAEEADRVMALSRSTLAFFRQGTEPEPTDLLAAAESVRFLLGTVLHQHKVALQIAGSGDVTVEALPGEPRQVLLNLIRNAFEASPGPDAVVSVTLTGLEDAVRIVVEDRGSGIAPELLPKLFHFGVTTKGARGNGMGLWSVQHILHRHGGSVAVRSQLGEGTTFTLLWPRRYRLSDAPAPDSVSSVVLQST